MTASFIPPTLVPSQALLEAANLIRDCREILDYRITTPDPPSWMPPSVSSYLLSLSDSDLHTCEEVGFGSYLDATNRKAPPFLKSLASRAALFSANFPLLPSVYLDDASEFPGQSTRRSKKRPRATKRAQIRQLAALTSHLLSQTTVPVTQIVDVGAGHAHLASHLATHLPSAPPIVAVDRDESLLRSAAELYAPLVIGPSPSLSLSCASIGDTALKAGMTDMLLGLHACGALGDAIVESAASTGPAAVALVSCCLQKLAKGDEVRSPLSARVRDDERLREALTLPRGTLGATNRTRGYVNGADVTARETRYALRELLQARGKAVSRAGDEVHGISRHRLRRGLVEVGGEVLQLNGLVDDLGREEMEQRQSVARDSYRVMRALTLPRTLAGEVMEMGVVLDRAAVLEESGRFRHVRTCRVWGDAVSVRNLCCVAWR